jgi:hypothetical protein
MNAPPVSEATLIVEVARSAMLDPEGGILETEAGVTEFPCATANVVTKKKKGWNANNPTKNDPIERLNFPQSPETSSELTAES